MVPSNVYEMISILAGFTESTTDEPSSMSTPSSAISTKDVTDPVYMTSQSATSVSVFGAYWVLNKFSLVCGVCLNV